MSLTQTDQRMSAEQALDMLRDPQQTASLMARSQSIRERLHGQRAYYVHSLNLNPTNICENRCELCAFWREPEQDDAYLLSLSQAREKLLAAKGMGLTDLHIVGGVTPKLNLAYYEDLLQMCREILPEALVQGLTAVEIRYLADLESISVEDTLQRLQQAGLGAIPGGGAEIFDEAIRKEICSDKISGAEWLAVHEAAHGLGIPTNATMLFGHIEEPKHIVDHLLRLRDLQDRTQGFSAFIALPFHRHGTKLNIEQAASGWTIARTVCLARVFLDNVPHIRLLADYLDRHLLQVLARCAVDDVGGTSLEERIAKAAGGSRQGCFSSSDDIESFLSELDLEPTLVNSAYATPQQATQRATTITSPVLSPAPRSESSARLNAAQAQELYDHTSFTELGRLANLRRFQQVPQHRATFVLDRNISLTNVCVSGCEFCAFYVDPGSPRAFTLSVDEVINKVDEAVACGATQIMIQGGLNPDLDLAFYVANTVVKPYLPSDTAIQNGI